MHNYKISMKIPPSDILSSLKAIAFSLASKMFHSDSKLIATEEQPITTHPLLLFPITSLLRHINFKQQFIVHESLLKLFLQHIITSSPFSCDRIYPIHTGKMIKSPQYMGYVIKTFLLISNYL